MSQDEATFYVMLTTISQQTMPVLLPFLQVDSPKFEEVYFLHTTEFKSQYTYVCDFLQKEVEYKPEQLIWYAKPLDNADLDVNTQIFEELIDSLVAKGKAEGRTIKVLCNLTPGTKPMSFGMREASRERDYCYHIYVDTQNETIIDYRNFFGRGKNYQFNMRISLRQYLEAHGLTGVRGHIPDQKMRRASLHIANRLRETGRQLQVGDKSFLGVVRQTVDDLEKHLKGNYRKVTNQNSPTSYPPNLIDLDAAVEEWLALPSDDSKRTLAQNLKSRLTLKVTLHPDQVWKLVEDLRKVGKNNVGRLLVEKVVKIKDGDKLVELEIHFGSFVALALLHGFWVEYYVYELLYQKYGFSDQEEGLEGVLAQSVRFVWENHLVSTLTNENELDVLLLRSGKLSIFSCKSGGNLRSGENNQALYHLDSIAGRIGLFSKKYVVVGQPEHTINEFKGRATSSKIEVIALDKMQNFIQGL
jgi:hypothetical protein